MRSLAYQPASYLLLAIPTTEAKSVQGWPCFGWPKPKKKRPDLAVLLHTQDLRSSLVHAAQPPAE